MKKLYFGLLQGLLAALFMGTDLYARKTLSSHKTKTSEQELKRKKSAIFEIKMPQKKIITPVQVTKEKIGPFMTNKEWKHKNKPTSKIASKEKNSTSDNTSHSTQIGRKEKEIKTFFQNSGASMEKMGSAEQKAMAAMEKTTNDVKTLFSKQPSSMDSSKSPSPVKNILSSSTFSQKMESDNSSYLGRDTGSDNASSPSNIAIL